MSGLVCCSFHHCCCRQLGSQPFFSWCLFKFGLVRLGLENKSINQQSNASFFHSHESYIFHRPHPWSFSFVLLSLISGLSLFFVCSVTFHFSFSTECRSRKLSHQGGDTDTAQLVTTGKLGHKEFLIIWSTLIKKITFILIFVNSAAACWQVYWSINRPECFWLYSAQLGFYSSNKTSTSTSMVASMIYKMFQVCSDNRYVTDRTRPKCLHNTTTHVDTYVIVNLELDYQRLNAIHATKIINHHFAFYVLACLI